MDSRQVQSHDYDEHHNHPHGHDVGIGIHQVLHGSDEHQHDHEKKSVVKKVKAKAKKIKDKVTKHGHHDNEHDHDHDQYHYEGQHIPDDHDLDEEDDEDEEMIDEDPEVHGAPIYDSAAVRSAVPGKTQILGNPNVNLGGTSVMGVEPHHHQPRFVVVSSTAEPDQSKVTDPTRTFVGVREDEAMHHKVNLERPMGLEEDPHAPRSSSPLSHAPANYQTKVTDPTGEGGGEIDITPVERSLERMNIQNEPKPNQESKILPTISETQYPSHLGGHHHNQFSPELSAATKTPFPTEDKSHDQHLPHLSSEIKTQYPSAGSHDQFVPEFSNTPYPPIKGRGQTLSQESTIQYPSTGSHDQFRAEPIPRSSNTYEQNPQRNEPTFGTTMARVDEQSQAPHEAMEKPSQSSYTDKISSASSAIADKAITAKNVVASKLGYAGKDDETKYHEENMSSDTPSNQSSYTEKISSATSAIADKAVSAKNTVASKLGYGDKGDSHEETQGENASSTSTTEYGKRIAQSLTDKLAPVYGKVAGVGSAVKSKVPGTSTGSESDKGVSVKDYFAEKLRPGDEDRALSEVISETLHHKRNKEEENVVHGEAEKDVKSMVSDAVHKRGEEEEEEHERRKKIPMGKVRESEEVKRRLGSGNEETERYEESYVNSPGKSVVDKVKDVVFSSWFTKPDENQPSEGGEQFPKNSGAVDVDQVVNQAADARRLHESYN